MKVQELGRKPGTHPPGEKPGEPRTFTVRIFAGHVEGAERAFAALTTAAVEARDLSVLARGPEVDRKLVFDPERNANQLADDRAPTVLSGLARKLSVERKHLLEGCWAAGPLFDRPSCLSGCGGETLVKVLLRAGFSLKESMAIESALQHRGGVWLAANLDQRAASRAVEALHRLPGLEIEWVPALSSLAAGGATR
jgi:hypothetical protein